MLTKSLHWKLLLVVVGVFLGCDGEEQESSLSIKAHHYALASLQAKLKASDAENYDYFGYAVALSGDTALVGSYQDDQGASNSGSAYVFTRVGTIWSQQQKLTTTEAVIDRYFGRSVAVFGDTAFVGAYQDDEPLNALYNFGSVYVYTRTGTTWSAPQKLKALDATSQDEFGTSVSIENTTAVIGAVGDSVGVLGGTKVGSAYVFVRNGTTWTQQQKLTASDKGQGDNFGASVSVSGITAFIGAWGDAYLLSDGYNYPMGSVYVFTQSGTVWTQRQKLKATDEQSGDWFGQSVSVSGDTALIGAWGNDSGGSDAGAAYIFTRTGATWAQKQKLMASDTSAGDGFGWTVSLSGDMAVVGAPFSDLPGTGRGGAAYVFARTGTIWTQKQKLTTSLTTSDAYPAGGFGPSVSVSGMSVLVGTSDAYPWSSGVYLFNLQTTIPSVISPVNGATLAGSSATFTWKETNAPVLEWWVYVGNALGEKDLYDSGSLGTATSTTVTTLPLDGRELFLRLWYRHGASWLYRDQRVMAANKVSLTAPLPNATLTSATATFNWTSNGSTVSEWWFYLGNTLGMNDLYDSGSLGTATSTVATNLPTDGRAMYARLWYRVAGAWRAKDEHFSAATTNAKMTLPALGSTLSSSNVTFAWSSGGAAVTEWWLYVGSSRGANNLYDSGTLGISTTKTVTGLPVDGRRLFVRLWYRVNNAWLSTDYGYPSSAQVVIQSPTAGTILSGSTSTVSWIANGAPVLEWWVYVGSQRGANDIFDSGTLGTTTSTIVKSFPVDGRPLFLRLWYRLGTPWLHHDVIVNAASYE